MDEYIQKVNAYRLATSIADTMRRRGIISDKDYEIICTVYAEKYGISLFSIFF